jgi:hypothetical protein
MISPCPKCGATKTDPVPHGVKYDLVWAFGYRLQRCSRCRTARYIPRHRGNSRGSFPVEQEPQRTLRPPAEPGTLGTADASPEPKEVQVTAGDSSYANLLRCPACGSTKHHRTQRTKLERMLQRPPMGHCERCGKRFPYLRRHDESPESVKSGEAVASTSHKREEGRGPRTTEESAQPNVDKQGATADSSNRELSRCPFCGSTAYRRSRRSTLEHLLLRPKMARCTHCRKRFPFPEK